MLNFDWLAGVSTDSAKWLFLSLYALIGLLVLLIPQEYIYKGLEHPRWYHNLKLWAIGVLCVIAVTYYHF